MYQKENKDHNSEKSHTLKVKVLKENQKIKNIVKVKRKVIKRSKVQTILYKHLKKKTYCLCDQVAFGKMLLCDNESCKIGWFHFDCLKIEDSYNFENIFFFCDECKKSKTSDNDIIFIKEESENISFKETEDIDIKDEIKEENKNIIFDEEVNFFAEENVLDIKEEFEHSEFDQESENINFKETEDIHIKDEIKEENKNIIFDEEVNFFAEEHVLDIKEEFEHSEFDQVMLMIELNTNMEKEEINEINILNNFFEDEICDDSLYNDCTDNLIN